MEITSSLLTYVFILFQCANYSLMLMGKNNSQRISKFTSKSKRNMITNKNLRAVIANGPVYHARNVKRQSSDTKKIMLL